MVTTGLTEPERIYAVGDVHGHADRLLSVHEAIRADLENAPVERAVLVHLGDYIDRGPDSAACLSALAGGDPIEGVPTVNLLGNHEQMLLDALADPRAAGHWRHNGGDATLLSWGIDPEERPSRWRGMIPREHLRLLEGLALSFQSGPFLFVHAGVRPGVSLPEQTPEDLLWIRQPFLEWAGPMLADHPELLIVHGHTPGREPVLRPNRLGLDTNAGRGGKVTCAALGADSVYFLQA